MKLSLLIFLIGLSIVFPATAEIEMSPDEAKNLIAKGEQLETIPKQTWRKLLTDEQYRILWQSGTERAFTGELLNNKAQGVYVTAGCQLPVFSSEHKYNSDTGWPSFWDMFNSNNIVLEEEWSWVGKRIEVRSKCGEHLGHVFTDGPEPTGLRYCINSKALLFVPQDEFEQRQSTEATIK